MGTTPSIPITTLPPTTTQGLTITLPPTTTQQPTTTKPPIICSSFTTKDNCNNNDICYYLNNSCNNKQVYSTLNNISSNDVKCSIYPNIELNNNTYLLYCINTNKNKNIVIKSIIIEDCTQFNNTECNILLDQNIEENTEFALKSYIHTFNNISGELTIKPKLNSLQVNKIKSNDSKITLIDIYNVKKTINVAIYDDNSQNILIKDNYLMNKNIENIYKVKQNIKNLI